MFPKTEKELELYFLLGELKLARYRMLTDPYLSDIAQKEYSKLKEEYLVKANPI